MIVWHVLVRTKFDRPTSSPYCATFYKINVATEDKSLPRSRALLQPLFPLVVCVEKHRETVKLEPLVCLLWCGDNSAVRIRINKLINKSSIESRAPAFKLHFLQPIILPFFFFNRDTLLSGKIFVVW